MIDSALPGFKPLFLPSRFLSGLQANQNSAYFLNPLLVLMSAMI